MPTTVSSSGTASTFVLVRQVLVKLVKLVKHLGVEDSVDADDSLALLHIHRHDRSCANTSSLRPHTLVASGLIHQ
jgi:hypothetical protein